MGAALATQVQQCKRTKRVVVANVTREAVEGAPVSAVAARLDTLQVTDVTLSAGLLVVPADLASLSHLTRLDLSYNRLSDLPATLSVLASTLSELNLEGNRFAHLPSVVLQLTRLRSLRLGTNRLRELPETLDALAALQELSVAQNVLDGLPGCLISLRALTALDASHNQMHQFPASVCALPRLFELRLAHNYLRDLSPSMAYLGHLSTLDVSSNRLGVLSPVLCQLPLLSTLLADSNQIVALPGGGAFAQMTALSTLSLENNALQLLPGAIADAPALRVLRLRGNPIRCLPPPLGRCASLVSLTLDAHELALPPPAVMKRGWEAVRAYLQHLSALGVTPDPTGEELQSAIVDTVSKQAVGREYTVYVIEFSRPPHRWRVARRFNSFYELNEQLERIFGPDVVLPPLPSKRVLGSTWDATVSSRRTALETYLRSLFSITRGVLVPCVVRFSTPPDD